MGTNISWWVTTLAGGLAAAAGGYATSDLPGNDVAASVAGLLGLVLGYLHPGRVRQASR